MNLNRPDAATLDEMVIGGVDDDQGPWEWLVSAPDAEATWFDAIRRRHRLDAIALAIQGRPWLAGIVSFVLARKPAKRGPAAESFIVAPTLLEAQLGEGAAAAEPIAAEWGGVTTRSVKLGQTVGLRLRESLVGVRFFYRCRDRQGELTDGRWTLEPDEAPVLLLACLNPRDTSDPDRAAATADASAGVLLLEAEDGETDR